MCAFACLGFACVWCVVVAMIVVAAAFFLLPLLLLLLLLLLFFVRDIGCHRWEVLTAAWALSVQVPPPPPCF
jgi:hypothetical protein